MNIGEVNKYIQIPSAEIVLPSTTLESYAHTIIASGGAGDYILSLLEGPQKRLWSLENTSNYTFGPLVGYEQEDQIYFTALRRTLIRGRQGAYGLVVPVGRRLSDGVYSYFKPHEHVPHDLAWLTNSAASMLASQKSTSTAA